MRRGWSRVPISAAPSGERTKIATEMIVITKMTNVM